MPYAGGQENHFKMLHFGLSTLDYPFPKKLSVNHSLKRVEQLDLGPPYLAPLHVYCIHFSQ